ncbi:Abc transporter c family member 5, partial [Globisporangium polare]
MSSSTPLKEQKSARARSDYGSLGDEREATRDDEYGGPRAASFLSRLFFSFANPLMAVGNVRQLSTQDIWELESENKSANAYVKFKTQFGLQQGSISRAIVATYGLPLLFCGLGALFSAGCAVFAPAVLHHVVDAFAAPHIDVEDLTVWLGAFFSSRLLNAVVAAHVGFYLELFGLRVTMALKALLFEKALRRAVQNKNDAKAVDISNLYTSDVDNILSAAYELNNIWILPLQIGVVIYMLYVVIGVAAFAGLAIIGVSVLAGVFIARLNGKAFEDIMKRKDERLKTVKEVFGAIQIVKLNAWEGQFGEKIHRQRAFELEAVAKYLYLVSTSIFVLWSSPIFVSTISFAVYAIVLDQTLTAAKVFTAIALFNAIRDPLRDLPDVIQLVIQAKVSLKRMSEFSDMEESDPSKVTRHDPRQPEDVVIAIENGSFGWTKDTPLLKNV